MCFHCQNLVEKENVLKAIGVFTQLLAALGLAPSVNLGIALRVLARLAQNGEWQALMSRIDDGDESAASEAETFGEATFQQMLDYARDFPTVKASMVDYDAVRDNYSAVLHGMAITQAPLSNELTAAMLALSDMMFESPTEPLTKAMMDDAIETAVFLTNAQKDGGSFSVN